MAKKYLRGAVISIPWHIGCITSKLSVVNYLKGKINVHVN